MLVSKNEQKLEREERGQRKSMATSEEESKQSFVRLLRSPCTGTARKKRTMVAVGVTSSTSARGQREKKSERLCRVCKNASSLLLFCSIE